MKNDTPRPFCFLCYRSQRTCYCQLLKPFESYPKFVILMHPHEQRRAIASGRLAHRCLSNSELFVGIDFSDHGPVNAILQNPNHHCLLLHPSKPSLNISEPDSLRLVRNSKKIEVIFVLDSTWREANKMLRFSENIKHLPRIHFVPERPSNYRIRLQPKAHCYATIESIHEVIRLYEGRNEGRHNHLLEVFDTTIDRQIHIQAHSPIR